MLAILERFAYTPFGTLGTLTYHGKSFVTVERPWLKNAAYISCIPEGSYTCKRYKSAKFPNTFEIKNVPGRSSILFHVGNTAKDVQGCVALGMMLDDNKYGILSSRRAFAEFINDMKGVREFDIKITQYKAEY